MLFGCEILHKQLFGTFYCIMNHRICVSENTKITIIMYYYVT